MKRLFARSQRTPTLASHLLDPYVAMPAQAADGYGWSYGETRRRVGVELTHQLRGIVALISILVIVQIAIGLLYLAASPLTLLAVEATLWSGIILGLHLGYRARRTMIRESRLSF